ncbi:MAG: 1-deoxy-D-xylulose-5-phosphate synthase [Bacilli bacterium]|jgi:1-deoxy-D-xylulose-5-phosphate synthase|nr:1-deoxy-D-xylulose-5-phosphate synthase [Bacilli bacterium]NLN80480.1 1-deoxy-D-xylulose-5-phosphate synthase [Erysipelotrichia bacterium]
MSRKERKTITKVRLEDIQNPSFLKDLNYLSLEYLASSIREEIILKTSEFGGHLSSNLGVVELTIALHRSFDFSFDKLLFDVGHQTYTHKILTGRSLDKLRTKDGVSGYQRRCESAFDCFEAGHSSTSLSAAHGFAIDRDLKGEKYDVVAVIGDASIVNGLAFEALNNISHLHNKVIIILNDNEMAISRPTGGMSKFFASLSTGAGYTKMKRWYHDLMFKTRFGRFLYKCTSKIKRFIKQLLVPSTYFDDMGFQYLGPIDGHNIKALENAFRRAKRTTKSVVIHVETIKGMGYKLAEDDQIGYWHGVTPFNIETGKPKNLHPELLSWSHLFSDLLDELMSKREDLIIISPATTKGSGLEVIFDKYPKRTFDVGISEGHALSLASGFALSGRHPIVSVYSTFLQRAFDQVIHDLARMDLNVTFLVDRAGLVGADGETHQGIYDEAFLINTPNVVLTMPSSDEEAKALLSESLKEHGPFFIRYPRDYLAKNHIIKTKELTLGKWIVELKAKTKKLAIIAVGQLLRELKQLIIDKNLDVTLINALYLKPIDEDLLKTLLHYENILLYDAYASENGFITFLKSKLSDLSYCGKIYSFGVKDQFVSHGKIKEQLALFNLLPEQVLAKIKDIIK